MSLKRSLPWGTGIIITNFRYIVAAFDPNILSAPGAYIADSDISDNKAPHAQSQVSTSIVCFDCIHTCPNQEFGEKLWELSENAVKEKFVI